MEIDDELEPLTIFSCEISSPAMGNLVRHVLKVIPDQYAEDFPSFSMFEAHSPWTAYVDDEGNVFLDPELLTCPTDVAIGTIAHEFAHVCLRHFISQRGLPDEYEADDLACKWGFAQEVEAMRQRYGPPTDS